VSIVTPSLNQARFIRETIESVLGQDYPRLEYFVVDGGSTDGTVAILEEYGDRLAWVSEADRGQAHAINAGWQRARGSVIAYLNSDDCYLPGAVRRAVAALEAHPEAGAVYGEGDHVDEAGRVIERYPTEPFSLGRLEETCFVCQPTVFLRRDVVERVGWLDESLRYCMDYDLWIRVGRVAPFVRLPDLLARSRLHPGSKTLGQRVPAHVETLHMIRRHFGRVPLSWTYAYAHAVLGPPAAASTAWASARFAARLASISLVELVRWNRGLSPRHWPRLGTSLVRGWRRSRAGSG
jgi:glycosyltransferase involved in cell wall biosynthesis